MQTQKRSVKAFIAMLIVVVVVGALFIASVFFGIGEWREVLFTRSETVYIILILALLLPVILIVLSVGVHKRNKQNEEFPQYAVELAETVFPKVEAERERLEREKNNM